jgi:hypothetical protein
MYTKSQIFIAMVRSISFLRGLHRGETLRDCAFIQGIQGRRKIRFICHIFLILLTYHRHRHHHNHRQRQLHHRANSH